MVCRPFGRPPEEGWVGVEGAGEAASLASESFWKETTELQTQRGKIKLKTYYITYKNWTIKDYIAHLINTHICIWIAGIWI